MNRFDFTTQELGLKLEKVQKKAIQLSLIRILAFLGFGIFLVLGLTESSFLLPISLLFGYFFIRLIREFNFQKDQESIYKSLEKILENRQKRMNRQLSGLDSGAEFIQKNHPFASDLDLFGEHSLFQLLNHSSTSGAKLKLAESLKAEFRPDKIPEKGSAVRQLAAKGNFLEAMEAVGLAFSKEKPNHSRWVNWLGEKERKGFGFRILAFLPPIVGLSILVLVSEGILSQGILGIWVILGIGFLGMIFDPLKKAAESIPPSRTLQSYLIRCELIEEEKFESSLLKELQALIFHEKRKTSQSLRELDSLGLWVQNRMNLLYLPINLLFWTDFFLFHRLAGWKDKIGQELSHLPENLETWEMWISLGAFEAELEGNGVVQISDSVILDVIEAKHPLISPEKAIGNTMTLGVDAQVILLTGANMSGKTTFMRTLGINCVLANLGLSPFADRLVMGDFQLYTSMRNSDNLGESVSSFYAELSRIKTLIDRLESGDPIFFLLDEILKGTNTEDRVSGSKALIHQILATRGFGIISTHDVELSHLGESVEKLHNFSFHSEIHDQEIQFDYLVKKGPCPSFNAHKLMELMGIRFGE